MKISIRDLFWLLTVLAVLFAWYGDRRNHIAVITSLERDVSDLAHRLWVVKDKRDRFFGAGQYYGLNAWERDRKSPRVEYDPRDQMKYE